jgi:hypothetical protein
MATIARFIPDPACPVSSPVSLLKVCKNMQTPHKRENVDTHSTRKTMVTVQGLVYVYTYHAIRQLWLDCIADGHEILDLNTCVANVIPEERRVKQPTHNVQVGRGLRECLHMDRNKQKRCRFAPHDNCERCREENLGNRRRRRRGRWDDRHHRSISSNNSKCSNGSDSSNSVGKLTQLQTHSSTQDFFPRARALAANKSAVNFCIIVFKLVLLLDVRLCLQRGQRRRGLDGGSRWSGTHMDCVNVYE